MIYHHRFWDIFKTCREISVLSLSQMLNLYLWFRSRILNRSLRIIQRSLALDSRISDDNLCFIIIKILHSKGFIILIFASPRSSWSLVMSSPAELSKHWLVVLLQISSRRNVQQRKHHHYTYYLPWFELSSGSHWGFLINPQTKSLISSI